MSSDFRDHPTTHLTQGMFRQHDRERVEVFGYSLGRDDASRYRRQVVESCDHFRDVSTLNAGETARRIHADGIDILVDLNGHTTGNRFEVLALKPAPIQVSYLGYPGTLGAEFVDYLLTDEIVTPPGMDTFFDEQLVRLPNCYQVNARDTPEAGEIPSRAACGLPESAFVFCCFNNPYKIDPLMFDVWARILQRVENSVLWLFGKYEAALTNLRREAKARGLARERLIFAERVPLAEHLARQSQADLFLDTYYYNAHTTASDMLWAGVPVLTCPGATFASRVCTSVLHAAGLPEMSVADLTAYENTAVALAGDPGRLQWMRQQLAANHASSPLFDSGRFVRNLENAYRQMWDAHEQGKPRGSIQIREERGENQNHGR
jgi:predicted O-linked N-acetylglucosamine transferase (SPINDLY family)